MADMHTPLPDYTAMTSGDMLSALRDDASKWATAFCQTAKKLGLPDIDEGWMIGWFANAIEQSSAVREFARASQEAETVKARRDDRYDQGRRDVLNAILALNPKAEALLAGLHEREPNPLGQMPFDVAVWVTEVAEQLGIKPKDEARAALAGSAS